MPERRLLAGLYDVLAPGNHGWHHHLQPDLRPLTVCANVTDARGVGLFRPLHRATIAGLRVIISAVIGEQAFACVPAADRAANRFVEPHIALNALRRVHGPPDGASWVVLSHAGYEHDLALARACPYLDVIFSGHCHSDRHQPTVVGTTAVVKGYELAAGYARAVPAADGWQTSVHHFASDVPESAVPAAWQPLLADLEHLRRRLAAPLGHLTTRFRHRPVNLAELLAATAGELRARTGAPAVLLNQTCLRATTLGHHLHVGDLLRLEPFGNRLITASLPPRWAADPAALLTGLTRQMGPIITAPDPLPAGLRHVLTTHYLASTFLDSTQPPSSMLLAEALQRLLTDAGPA